MINFLDNANFKLMQKTLDATWERMNVIAENITNVDTPGYKAKRLEFENILRNKMYGSDNESYSDKLKAKLFPETVKDNSLDSVKPIIYTDPSTQMRVDGNNVDIDHENLELVKAKMQYDYLVRKITDEYNLLRYAITEGRG